MKVSFWFAPMVMSLGAILLAWAIYWVDGLIPNETLQNSRLILSGTPGELRAMLVSMAGTILATAGVVFTLLTLPLSTVAAQYGSRLLRVFLGNRITQLVEMAVRAMSPAINDPFTAMTCLDYIGEGLALFIRQGEKDPHFYCQDGRLCLIFEPVTFEGMFSSAFDMLRHCSCDNASVLQHMLEVIDAISHETGSPKVKSSIKVRQELLRQVSLIQAESQAGKLIEQDRQLIQHSSEALMMKLKEAR
jgi:uncharacterized membrane protein